MTEQCGAATRSGGKCAKTAGWGTSHPGIGCCKLHAGSTPNAELAGVVELARRQAAVMGAPLAIEPQDALIQCIHITAGEVAYASAQIALLEEHEAVGAVVTTHVRPAKLEKGEDSSSREVTETRYEAPALHIWIRVRQQAMDRLVNYSKVAIAAGLAERQVRLAERQGQLLAQVIRGVLTDLGVADHPEVGTVVRKHLTLVAGQPVLGPGA